MAGHPNESSILSFRHIVRNSALLNGVIVLTSFPVLVLAAGSRAVMPALAIMAGISLVIWTATFTVYSCLSIGRLLWMIYSSRATRKPRRTAGRVGVSDRWLDAPG